jgi:hypothetical protein
MHGSDLVNVQSASSDAGLLPDSVSESANLTVPARGRRCFFISFRSKRFGGPLVPPALVRKVLAELERPLPHALVADDDAARGQHLLDHAQAEGKAEIQPNRMADDLGRKPVAGVAGEGRRCHPIRLRDLAR